MNPANTMTVANPSPAHLVLEGRVAADMTPHRTLRTQFLMDGVGFRNASGADRFIRTAAPPASCEKVDALDPLAPLLDTDWIQNVELGGGAIRAAVATVENRNGTPLDVHLVTETDWTPRLESVCRKYGIWPLCLGRYETPNNLVIPRTPNRLIVRDRPQRRRLDLTADQERQVSALAESARAVALVSPKDPLTAGMAFRRSNGSRKYFQPTGSLEAAHTTELARLATHLVANFEEWKILATWADADLTVPRMGESDKGAPRAVASLMRQLNGLHVAGREAAVATLGRHGVVVADWRTGEVAWLAFVPLTRKARVDTPAGTGDQLLGSFIAFTETWASEGQLRHPVKAAADRAMRYVCRKLGLTPTSYRIVERPA